MKLRELVCKTTRGFFLAGMGAIAFFSNPVEVRAGKLDLGAGFFMIGSNARSTPISNLGSYRISYKHPIGNSLEVGIGYTFILSGIVTGDSAYGFDILACYYPFSSVGTRQIESDRFSFELTEDWRPYFGLSFNQRQIQSVQTNYTGFGGEIGVEKSLTQLLSAKLAVRYVLLGGPNSASGSELDILPGIVFQF